MLSLDHTESKPFAVNAGAVFEIKLVFVSIPVGETKDELVSRELGHMGPRALFKAGQTNA